jgi:hypothetical protein
LACCSAGGVGGSSYPLHDLIGLSPEDSVKASISRFDTRLDEDWQSEQPEEYAKKLKDGLAACHFARDEPGAVQGKNAKFLQGKITIRMSALFHLVCLCLFAVVNMTNR